MSEEQVDKPELNYRNNNWHHRFAVLEFIFCLTVLIQAIILVTQPILKLFIILPVLVFASVFLLQSPYFFLKSMNYIKVSWIIISTTGMVLFFVVSGLLYIPLQNNLPILPKIVFSTFTSTSVTAVIFLLDLCFTLRTLGLPKVSSKPYDSPLKNEKYLKTEMPEKGQILPIDNITAPLIFNEDHYKCNSEICANPVTIARCGVALCHFQQHKSVQTSEIEKTPSKQKFKILRSTKVAPAETYLEKDTKLKMPAKVTEPKIFEETPIIVIKKQETRAQPIRKDSTLPGELKISKPVNCQQCVAESIPRDSYLKNKEYLKIEMPEEEQKIPKDNIIAPFLCKHCQTSREEDHYKCNSKICTKLVTKGRCDATLCHAQEDKSIQTSEIEKTSSKGKFKILRSSQVAPAETYLDMDTQSKMPAKVTEPKVYEETPITVIRKQEIQTQPIRRYSTLSGNCTDFTHENTYRQLSFVKDKSIQVPAVIDYVNQSAPTYIHRSIDRCFPVNRSVQCPDTLDAGNHPYKVLVETSTRNVYQQTSNYCFNKSLAERSKIEISKKKRSNSVKSTKTQTEKLEDTHDKDSITTSDKMQQYSNMAYCSCRSNSPLKKATFCYSNDNTDTNKRIRRQLSPERDQSQKVDKPAQASTTTECMNELYVGYNAPQIFSSSTSTGMYSPVNISVESFDMSDDDNSFCTKCVCQQTSCSDLNNNKKCSWKNEKCKKAIPVKTETTVKSTGIQVVDFEETKQYFPTKPNQKIKTEKLEDAYENDDMYPYVPYCACVHKSPSDGGICVFCCQRHARKRDQPYLNSPRRNGLDDEDQECLKKYLSSRR